jgi:hypothetical protein
VGKVQSFGPKPVKFFNFWAEHDKFLNWVSEGWQCSITGVPLFRFHKKLKANKMVLKRINREVFGGLQ